jgi:hypothetical protein
MPLSAVAARRRSPAAAGPCEQSQCAAKAAACWRPGCNPELRSAPCRSAEEQAGGKDFFMALCKINAENIAFPEQVLARDVNDSLSHPRLQEQVYTAERRECCCGTQALLLSTGGRAWLTGGGHPVAPPGSAPARRRLAQPPRSGRAAQGVACGPSVRPPSRERHTPGMVVVQSAARAAVAKQRPHAGRVALPPPPPLPHTHTTRVWPELGDTCKRQGTRPATAQHRAPFRAAQEGAGGLLRAPDGHEQGDAVLGSLRRVTSAAAAAALHGAVLHKVQRPPGACLGRGAGPLCAWPGHCQCWFARAGAGA